MRRACPESCMGHGAAGAPAVVKRCDGWCRGHRDPWNKKCGWSTHECSGCCDCSNSCAPAPPKNDRRRRRPTAETNLVEDKAPCADGRRANGDGTCTEAGKDRPFCVRARANRFGGSKGEMCKRKGMRRACPESCMGHGAAAETNLVQDQ